MVRTERALLLQFLADARQGLRNAATGLTADQASDRPTTSALSVAGLIKHAAENEQGWTARLKAETPEIKRDQSNWDESFRLVGDETLEGMLAYWEKVAAETDAHIQGLDTLDETIDLPKAPWFPKDPVNARWVVLHLIREFNRHAGHADIVRESIDGKSAWELAQS